jgi:hypothetical protein
VTVDSSASIFKKAEIMLPLLKMMPSPATIEAVTDEEKPYKNRPRVIGTPVKSNLIFGYHGKGSLSPEYFKV